MTALNFNTIWLLNYVYNYITISHLRATVQPKIRVDDGKWNEWLMKEENSTPYCLIRHVNEQSWRVIDRPMCTYGK